MAEVESLEIRITGQMSEASNSIDKLCSRLDVLGKSVGKIGSSSDGNFKKLNLAYSKIGNMFKSSSASSKVLTESLVKSYAAIKSIEKVFDKLSTSLKNSMDYVETFNYWNVALDKISGDFSKQFEKYGYDSAEAYAKSFSERLKVLNQKLTGYAIGDNGELQLTNQIGVGLDVGKLMNYQAKILSVTNSVGLLGETSIDVSKVMSMLASDFSSLTNTDLDTVMTNLQSGLIGQSRALYKYGIDITNATLQTYAYEHGITKAVTAMSQGEKMQLRVLAILDQSKVAWGDAANTMNSVANQWRIMGQQVSNVSRLFGTLLLPIVQKVLPVVNGLLIALQKLMSTLGFKMWGDTWLKDTMSGISSGGLPEIENLDESLENASESAKKLKTHLLGIDELNVVEPADNSGASMGSVGGGIDLSSDISAALAEYESVWDKAFNESLNKAQEYADKFINVASRIWAAIEPLRTSVNKLWNEGFSLLMGYTFQNMKDFYTEFLVPLGTWAFGTEDQGLTRLVDIVNNSLMQIDWPFITQNLKDFWGAIEPFVEHFGEGLIDFFEDVSSISVDIINKIFGNNGAITGVTNFFNNTDPRRADKWGYSLGIVATGLIALSAVGKALSGLAGIGTAIAGVTSGLGALFGSTGVFASIGTGISGFFGPFISSFSEMIALVSGGAGTLGESFAVCFPNISAFITSISPLTAGLAALGASMAYVFATNENVRTSFSNLVTTLTSGLSPVLSKVVTAVKDGLSESLSDLKNNVLTPLGDLVSSVLSPILITISDALSILSTNIIIPLADAIGNVFVTGIQGATDIFETWTVHIKTIIVAMKSLWEKILLPIADFIWSGFKPIFETVAEAIGKVISGLGTSLSGVLKFVTGVFAGNWENAWNGVKDVFKGVFDIVSWIVGSVAGFITEKFEAIRKVVADKVTSAKETVSTAFENIKKTISDKVGQVKLKLGEFKDSIDGVIKKIKDFFGFDGKSFSIGLPTKIFEGFKDLIGKAVDKLKELFGFNGRTVTINTKSEGVSATSGGFATGGYPQPATYFWAGENGVPEILGTVGGRTAVAGGAEITGIRDAVYDASNAEVHLLQEQNALLRALLEKDVSVRIGDKDIAQANRRGEKRLGYRFSY